MKCLETRRQHGCLKMRRYEKDNGRRVKTMEIPWTLWLRARSNVMAGLQGYEKTEAARDRIAQVKVLLAEGNKSAYIAAVIGVTPQRVRQIKARSKEIGK
jgi:hypothetical protein